MNKYSTADKNPVTFWLNITPQLSDTPQSVLQGTDDRTSSSLTAGLTGVTGSSQPPAILRRTRMEIFHPP